MTDLKMTFRGKIDDIYQMLCEAGDIILQIYEEDNFQVETKSDESPVTIADKLSSHFINSQLQELTPGIPVIDEENLSMLYADRKDKEYLWVLDPLDGTKEFIKKNGEFTINLAFLHFNKPVLGFIYSPVKQLGYIAAKGEGATVVTNEGKSKITVSPSVVETKSIKILVSRSNPQPKEEALYKKLEQQGFLLERIPMGGALKYGCLAEGKADLYCKYGHTSEWDTAPGQLLLEETGGCVLRFADGLDLEYNKQDLSNPPFYVQSSTCTIKMEEITE